jgi:hypothetical protein
MALLYRTPLLIRRKQPYVDWAVNVDEESRALAGAFSDRCEIYLAPVAAHEQALEEVLGDCWEAIFEEELAGWIEDESTWPPDRTRAMFDAWFSAELADAVIDLVPDEPLTEDDVDAADAAYVLTTCAWCEAELDEETGRTVGFELPDRSRLGDREGRAWTLAAGKDRFVTGIVTMAESNAAAEGTGVVFRACGRTCERLLRKTVPKAIREATRMLSGR